MYVFIIRLNENVYQCMLNVSHFTKDVSAIGKETNEFVFIF